MDARQSLLQISLIMPAYNEAAVIAQAVQEAETSLRPWFDDFEVLIVDDGSHDQTAGIVTGLLPSAPHTRLLRHGQNRGYGTALRTGFEAARFPLVAFTDADCQFDLGELKTLARIAQNHSIVCGYRANRKDSWRRCFFSWGYNVLARTLLNTGGRDVDCALKVFQWDVLRHLLPNSRGFFVNTEMMTRARRLGFEVVEYPVTHRPRARGESKVSLREIPRTALHLLRFWWSEVVLGPASVRPAPVVFQSRVTVAGEADPRVSDHRSSRSPAPRAAPPELHREAA